MREAAHYIIPAMPLPVLIAPVAMNALDMTQQDFSLDAVKQRCEPGTWMQWAARSVMRRLPQLGQNPLYTRTAVSQTGKTTSRVAATRLAD